jgi:hypothetical protein
MAGQFYAKDFFKQGFWASGFWANTATSVQELVSGVGKKKKKESLRVNLRDVENRLSTADFLKQALRDKYQETIVEAKAVKKAENVEISPVIAISNASETGISDRKAQIDRMNNERILLILAAAI